jgi:tetratricopeptide (TPR) repeat protein
MVNREDWWRDVKTIAKFLSVFLGAGLSFVWMEQSILHGLRSYAPWAALVWAFAFLAFGALVGFVFGIPRAPNGGPPGAGLTTSSPSGDATQADRGDDQQITLPTGTVNTNLEQISDWLTKIIVGATLVQFQKMPEAINRAASFVGSSLGDPEQKFFAGGLLIYFTILGFLGSYLLTRLYLQPIFAKAATLPISKAEREEIRQAPIAVRSATPQLTSDAQKAVKRLLDINLEELSSAGDIAVWAKAQLASKNYAEAVRGYDKALERLPDDINLRVDFAQALKAAGRPLEEVKQQLLDAYQRLTPQTDKMTKERVYRTLVFTLVYMSPPGGFSDAIKYGEEYSSDKSNLNDGGIYTTLAAAYGQRYRWEKERGVSGEKLTENRDKALEAARAAIALSKDWIESLRILLDPQHRAKELGEDDLEVFVDDPDFRELLELPPLPNGN